MSSTIQQRVEALEHAGGTGVTFMLIVRRFVDPLIPPGEATQAQALGQQFEREPAETEAQFIERVRAYALAHREPGQPAAVVQMEETDLDL